MKDLRLLLSAILLMKKTIIRKGAAARQKVFPRQDRVATVTYHRFLRPKHRNQWVVRETLSTAKQYLPWVRTVISSPMTKTKRMKTVTVIKRLLSSLARRTKLPAMPVS